MARKKKPEANSKAATICSKLGKAWGAISDAYNNLMATIRLAIDNITKW